MFSFNRTFELVSCENLSLSDRSFVQFDLITIFEWLKDHQTFCATVSFKSPSDNVDKHNVERGWGFILHLPPNPSRRTGAGTRTPERESARRAAVVLHLTPWCLQPSTSLQSGFGNGFFALTIDTKKVLQAPTPPRYQHFIVSVVELTIQQQWYPCFTPIFQLQARNHRTLIEIPTPVLLWFPFLNNTGPYLGIRFSK